MISLWILFVLHDLYVLNQRDIDPLSKVNCLEKLVIFFLFIEVVVNLGIVEDFRVHTHELLNIFQADVVFESSSEKE